MGGYFFQGENEELDKYKIQEARRVPTKKPRNQVRRTLPKTSPTIPQEEKKTQKEQRQEKTQAEQKRLTKNY